MRMLSFEGIVAKFGSKCPLIGTEPACGISASAARIAVMICTRLQKHWEFLTGLRWEKRIIGGLSATGTKES
jgi:hypothetical protein